MADEITVRPKQDSESTPTKLNEDENEFTLTLNPVVSVCAVGLGVSFFLPWIHVLFTEHSGFDIQKQGGQWWLLWLIPIFSIFTMIAVATKSTVKEASILTGMAPYIAGLFMYLDSGKDLLQILCYGAYLSLAFGGALMFLAQKVK